MRRRWLVVAAVVLAVAAIGLRAGPAGPPSPGGGPGDFPRELGRSGPALPSTSTPERGAVRAVAPVVGAVTREQRVAEAAAEAAEGRANRQRVLFRNLSELDAAAERAERAGNLAYAAALRRRAEILAEGVRSE